MESEGSELQVCIGDGDVRLVLEGPPFAEHVGARLEGPFLNVGDSVVLDESLVEYFGELDRAWRGWDGARTWVAAGGGLKLQARHGGVGHMLLEATFLSPEYRDDPRRDGAWLASAVVVVEAGSLGRVARELRALRDHESAK